MIEMGKTYRTRDGREARVFLLDGGGMYPVIGAIAPSPLKGVGSLAWVSNRWTPDGRDNSPIHISCADLIEVKPTITRTYWLTHYPEAIYAYWQPDKPVDTAAIAITGPHEITFTEGEGL